MTQAITRTDVHRAATELATMRRSLGQWVVRRAANDARGVAVPGRMQIEQDLADKLHALLSEVMPDAVLPNADLRSNPNAAVQLAQIAVTGKVPVMQSSPASMGSAAQPWLWPVLIVGGLLLAITTAIKTAADVAKDSEEKACIKAGACTDYGFWLKAAAVLGISWFAWKEMGVGDVVRGFVKKGRS